MPSDVIKCIYELAILMNGIQVSRLGKNLTIYLLQNPKSKECRHNLQLHGVDNNIELHGVIENTIEPLQGAIENIIELEDTLIVHEPKLKKQYLKRWQLKKQNLKRWQLKKQNLKRLQWSMKLKLKTQMILCLQILRIRRMIWISDMD